MSKTPDHYRLHQEHDKHFVIHDERDGQKFHVAKKDLHPATQIKIMKMQKPQHFDNGGEVLPNDTVLDRFQNLFDPEALPQMQAQLPGAVVAPNNAVDVNALTPQVMQQEPDWSAPMVSTQPQAQIMPQPGGEPGSPQINTSQLMPGMSDGGMKALQGIQGMYESGVRQEVKGAKDQAHAQAQAWEAHNSEMAQVHAMSQQRLEDIQAKMDQVSNDIATSKVDYNRWWNNKSTGAHVLNGVALLLGGIGAGLQGSSNNVAWNAIQSSMDKDIQSQKDDLGRKQSLLSNYYHQYGNIVQAEQATRLHMSAMIQGQLAKVAAQTADPIIEARAKQNIATSRRRDFPLQMSVSQMQAQNDLKKMIATQNVNNVDPSTLVEKIIPEKHRQKVYAEIESAQNTKKMAKSIVDAFEKAAKENTFVKTGAGFLRTPGSVYALHQAMQPTFKDLEGTVRQAAMDNTFKNITPVSGDSDYTVDQKREALYEYLQSKASAPVAKGNGIDLGRFESTKPLEFHHTETKGGVKYRRK